MKTLSIQRPRPSIETRTQASITTPVKAAAAGGTVVIFRAIWRRQHHPAVERHKLRRKSGQATVAAAGCYACGHGRVASPGRRWRPYARSEISFALRGIRRDSTGDPAGKHGELTTCLIGPRNP